MSDSDSRCYLGLHEVFVALETKRLCKFVSLVMVWPGEQYISGAFQAQSSSAYSSSTDEGWIPRNTVYWAGSGAFFQVCRAEGATCSWCAPGGSRESVKCQIRQEACAPRWSNQLHDITAEVATSKFVLFAGCKLYLANRSQSPSLVEVFQGFGRYPGEMVGETRSVRFHNCPP